MSADGVESLSKSLTSIIRGVDMFSRKKFTFNGKVRQKVSPSPSPPEPAVTESTLSIIDSSSGEADYICCDFIGIEEYLSNINDHATRRASFTLAVQLKKSRALLSLRSYLSSNDGKLSTFDRLVDMAHQVCCAENVFLLQEETSGVDLIVTHSHTNTAIGMKIPVASISSGIFVQTYRLFSRLFVE
jgi:hypothetical protein